MLAARPQLLLLLCHFTFRLSGGKRLYCSDFNAKKVLCAVEDYVPTGKSGRRMQTLTHLISHDVTTVIIDASADAPSPPPFKIGPFKFARKRSVRVERNMTELRFRSGSCGIKYSQAVAILPHACIRVPGLLMLTGQTIFSLPKYEGNYVCQGTTCEGLILRAVSAIPLPARDPGVKFTFTSHTPEVSVEVVSQRTSSLTGTIKDLHYIKRGRYLDEEVETVKFNGAWEGKSCPLEAEGFQDPSTSRFGEAFVIAVDSEYVLFVKRKDEFMILRGGDREAVGDDGWVLVDPSDQAADPSSERTATSSNEEEDWLLV
ncbi:hypothetical protein FOZ62_000246 [Perkinsus olseni]|uniref:Uncharacterized protein n=2 Tax=Perkinsus olseni TaxID=32597 RepID=A0A7J6S272_PEROL|nr:hypothetical protein FOZ62_000246 [Perkinsus olseni]